MKIFKKNIFILTFIILIAGFLRFNQLSVLPPALTWDEVSWGYNAYSLGIDGKDEFGRFLPYDYLESFGDFKPPIYAYFDILPVKIFGLTEFAVRFPSALFGTLTVLLTYFLTKSIFSSVILASEQSERVQNRKRERFWSRFAPQNDEFLPLMASFLLAISPWHIMLSRAAFEANVATFLIVLGVWTFLEAVQRKKHFLISSAIAFVGSIYTFNTARIVSPILILGLSIVYWRQLFQIKKEVIVSIIVGLILILPVVPFLLSPQASLRYKEVNIFSDITVIERTNQEIANDNNAWWSNIIHNRRIAFAGEYLRHYFDNLSSPFLFIKGDGNPKFSTQSLGQLYVFELPFLIAGVLFLFRKREKNWWIIPFWLLVGIIPAATARETPHALRIETTLPMFQILVAYGIVNIFNLFQKLKAFKFFALCYVLFAAFNIAYFLNDYYSHYAKVYSQQWQYGYKEAINYINEVEKNYNKIYLTTELGRPYIYTLFYKQYDPILFREEAVVHRDTFGFVNVISFNKYYFDKEVLKKTGEKNILLIDSPVDVPKGVKVLKQFKSLDGKDAMVAYTL